MSDTVILALIAASFPIISNIITHILASKARKAVEVKLDDKLDNIVKVSNGMLNHITEKKEEAEKKLEQVKIDELLITKTKLVEAEKQIALLTNPNSIKIENGITKKD